MWGLDVLLDDSLLKPLNQQSSCRWFKAHEFHATSLMKYAGYTSIKSAEKVLWKTYNKREFTAVSCHANIHILLYGYRWYVYTYSIVMWLVKVIFAQNSDSHKLNFPPCVNAENAVVFFFSHYSDVIMSAIVSQITSPTILYSTVYSDTDQRKHQSSASPAFVWGIHRWWIPRTKGQ